MLSPSILPQIAELERKLFPDDAWTIESIESLLQQAINDVITLTKDGELLGYCLYQIVFETAEILRIGVNPSQQHQGIGTAILAVLTKRLRKDSVQTLMLEVDVTNQTAVNFYHKHGFITLHMRKGYYQKTDGSPHDAAIMTLSL